MDHSKDVEHRTNHTSSPSPVQVGGITKIKFESSFMIFIPVKRCSHIIILLQLTLPFNSFLLPSFNLSSLLSLFDPFIFSIVLFLRFCELTESNNKHYPAHGRESKKKQHNLKIRNYILTFHNLPRGKCLMFYMHTYFASTPFQHPNTCHLLNNA